VPDIRHGIGQRKAPRRASALTRYPHWRVSFAGAAESVRLDIGLVDAVEQVNTWIKLIDGA
jgi:hypothetical protein